MPLGEKAVFQKLAPLIWSLQCVFVPESGIFLPVLFFISLFLYIADILKDDTDPKGAFRRLDKIFI